MYNTKINAIFMNSKNSKTSDLLILADFFSILQIK